MSSMMASEPPKNSFHRESSGNMFLGGLGPKTCFLGF